MVPLPPEHVLLLLARRRARQRRGAHLPGDGWTMERDDCCLGFFMVAACYPLLSRIAALEVEKRSWLWRGVHEP